MVRLYKEKLGMSSGEAFTISSDSIIPTQNPQLTMRLKFLFLIRSLLEGEGEDIDSISHSALSRRFNVNRTTIGDAFED